MADDLATQPLNGRRRAGNLFRSTFLLSSNVVVKMLALGLGISIIVDASIIRLLVVPATMFLMGRANWWTPRWLSRLPELLEPAD